MATENMNIQWYPGHMTKTRRQIEADLKQVDAVCEILDARIPIASRNPDIDAICGSKPRIVILNRMDLADPEATKRWISYFREKGIAAVATDCKSRKGIANFQPAVRSVLKEKIERNAAKGMNKPVRVMIVGIPNVGKSTLINQISGRKGAKAENRPGVTRGKQWVTVDNTLLLLDTPGILWPKFEDPDVGMMLAYTGAVKENVIDIEELACRFMELLNKHYPQVLLDRYRVEPNSEMSGYDLLEAAGRKRGFLVSGGEINTERMAKVLLDEYRSGKLGFFTFRNAGGHKMSLENLWQIEESYFDKGVKLIAGVDEAGRGPLAGPVCAAAVILPASIDIPGLNDSKKLSDKQRRALYPIIKEKAIAYGIAFASETEIDEINILQATYLAMQRAVAQLTIKPELLLIDGNRLPQFDIAAETVIHGDSLSASIAAASVLAKVTRDDYMLEQAEKYPEYGFEVHKGYGTKAHYAALETHGHCPLHRVTFLKKFYGRNNIVGAWGETLAGEYLRKKHYKLEAVNFRSRFGEIDLIVSNRKYLVFVEVKLRKSANFARAAEFVNYSKQQKLRTTAELYLAQNPTKLQPRFDVIEIYAPNGIDTDKPEIYHMEDAFQ